MTPSRALTSFSTLCCPPQGFHGTVPHFSTSSANALETPRATLAPNCFNSTLNSFSIVNEESKTKVETTSVCSSNFVVTCMMSGSPPNLGPKGPGQGHGQGGQRSISPSAANAP